MKAQLRRVTLSLAAAALLASSFAAPPASSQLDPALPSLDLDALLSIARVDIPPAGVSLELHMDFPIENPLDIAGVGFTSLTAVIHPDRSVDMQHAVTAKGDGGTQSGECSDQTFMPTGRTWDAADLPVEWRFRPNSTPPKNHIGATTKALRRAHRIWPQGISRCDDNHNINFGYSYAGVTGRSVEYDKRNIVEFGKLGGGALAINYTWFSGTRILETDLRFNRSEYPWTNLPDRPKRYQVANVAAHELGHQLGLDDLDDPHGGLTMFGRISRGEKKKMTLGAGDLRGASRLTP